MCWDPCSYSLFIVDFYNISYCPRRQRQRLLAESENWSPKESEAGVIDIEPEVDKVAEVGSANEPDRVRISRTISYIQKKLPQTCKPL